jgi:polyisoprenoid-binding protein YceI
MKITTLTLMAAAMMMSASLRASNEIAGEDNAAKGPAFAYNTSASTVYWEGTKPGGMHHGTIEVVSGNASTDGEMITGGSFELDMTTIRNEDVQNDGMRERLVNHLLSEDFFYVEKYPKASFVITGVEQMPGESSMHMVTGDLTIRGNTNQITFPAEITMEDQVIRARTGKIVLDRTRWEVNHMSKSVFASMKDNFIDDEMVVKLDVLLDRN